MENQFNDAAGFAASDDDLPDFFYSEALAPTNNLARFHGAEVKQSAATWWQQNLPTT